MLRYNHFHRLFHILGLNRPQPEMEDFEFKDADPYNNEEPLGANFDDEHDTLTLNTVESSTTVPSNSRLVM